MKKFIYILSGLVLAVFLLLIYATRKPKSEMAKANREQFIKILRSSGRTGVESVISQLDSTDFFTRGAGGHHDEEGGLVQHSLEVYRIMRFLCCFQSSGDVAVIALFHDMGKIDTDGWHPWRSVKHLTEWGFELTEDEFYIIFRHHTQKLKYYRFARRRALTLADALSTGWWKLWHKNRKSDNQP
ncbi:MAG: HD domain-containing protein [Bacteroidales bacterium]|nr:HD domain-containing protein [Bacteroidales bacterium]MBO7640318.1 HD domain-containing protein [Bacteroidales bacterium]